VGDDILSEGAAIASINHPKKVTLKLPNSSPS